MIDFETWWNSSSADEFRRLNDDMDGRVVRPVWDAAIRATLSSQKATSAAPSPEATQPTQAEAPSEREAREMQEVADKLREAGYHSAANNTERTIADIKSGNMPRAVIGAALATQQAVQAEPVGFMRPDELQKAAKAPYLCRVHPEKDKHADMVPVYATPPAPGQVEREREDAVLAYLDKLEDDAAVHIWPDDLAKCQTSECVVEVASVRMGSPDGKTLPLFSRDQVRDAVRAARSSEGGSNG